MRKALGYRIITDPYTQTEIDTATCCHCARIINKKPFEQIPEALAARCTCCDALMCAECAKRGGCLPIEKRLDQYEAKMRFRSELMS